MVLDNKQPTRVTASTASGCSHEPARLALLAPAPRKPRRVREPRGSLRPWQTEIRLLVHLIVTLPGGAAVPAIDLFVGAEQDKMATRFWYAQPFDQDRLRVLESL